MGRKDRVKETAVLYKVKKPSKKFSVVIEKDTSGYFAFCPELQGCYTQGETYEEAMSNIKDAIELHIEDRLKNNEEILLTKEISLTTVEI
ncbi:MAG TPA: type II toxin-antitoxin system HicB family antitoxin [Elusimicrobia bacterium]|nr:type II toxin-antitoxin system HicB family antitoxin [Elusimicrobiota bacterium]